MAPEGDGGEGTGENEQGRAELREIVVDVVKEVLPDFLTGDGDDASKPVTRSEYEQGQSEMRAAMAKLGKPKAAPKPKGDDGAGDGGNGRPGDEQEPVNAGAKVKGWEHLSAMLWGKS
jgi:hypothetical protein